MTVFRYRAVAADGRMRRGRLAAASAAELELRLGRMQLDLVAAAPVRTRWLPGRARSLPRRELIHFCGQLEQVLRAGLPIVDGLRALRDGGAPPRLRELLAGIAAAIEGGQSLSGALAAHPAAFDSVFVGLVRTGETAGRLPEILARLAEALKWRDELAAQARRIAAYPLLVGGAVLAAAVFLMTHVAPQLRAFTAGMGQTPPPSAQALFLVADGLAAHWPALLAAVAAAGAAARLWLRVDPAATRTVDRLKLRLPLVGDILAKLALARFAGGLALLYAAGVPIVEALATVRETVGNRAIEDGLDRVEQAIADGRCLSQAFAGEDVFPPLVIRMLRVGEDTGGLDRALTGVCYFYERDVREAVERAQALAEPALTLFLGLLLGWIMLAVLGPVYDLVGGIGA
ncbi:MAG: type II secretion system F family protein [Rhodocyclaceae bacterium]|nr:type II secretion system F family protein [Rhodocyclaceae bacterium]